MSDEDVRNYLARKKPASTPAVARPRMAVKRRPPKAEAPDTFKDFSASHLLCPRCKQAMPVRSRLLLYLPDGDLYDYSCTACGTSCGTRKAER